jgi:hypothetical protein
MWTLLIFCAELQCHGPKTDLTKGSIENAIRTAIWHHVFPLEQHLIAALAQVFVRMLQAYQFGFREVEDPAQRLPVVVDMRSDLPQDAGRQRFVAVSVGCLRLFVVLEQEDVVCRAEAVPLGWRAGFL